MAKAYGRIYVWQLQNDYPGAEVNDSLLNIGEMWVKAADGMYHMGHFDNHALEVGLPDQISPIREIYDSQRINMIPWVVPHGKYPGYGPDYTHFAAPLKVSQAVEGGSKTRPDLAAINLSGRAYAYREGFFHGLYATACKDLTPKGYKDRAILIVDLEPSYYGGATPQFWREDLGAGPAEVHEYIAGAKAAGTEEIWVASVHRNNPSALRHCSFSTWWANPLVTKLAPQTYWTDFGSKANPQKPIDAINEFNRSMVVLKEDWKPSDVILTLPATGTAADLHWAYQYAFDNGYEIPAIWRRGTMREDGWGVVKSLKNVDWPVLDIPNGSSGPNAGGGAGTPSNKAIEVLERTGKIKTLVNEIESLLQP